MNGFLARIGRMLTGSSRTVAEPGLATAVADGDDSPGRFGTDATIEIDPRRLGAVRMGYSPVTDGDPDPGEIVWTWVPYEENDGRGKDRPMVIVATEAAGTVLAAQLTSKDHGGERDYLPLGTGGWDRSGRPSWVNIDRIFRVHPHGMRREASALDRARYEQVEEALRLRYGWS
ncbi:MAG: type II toxin-antitoxin system PemK/MazF family toxin [Leifsonia sp.]